MPGPRIIASSLIRVIADQNLESQYDRWADEIRDVQKEIAAREAKYADPLDAYDEVEHLITKLDRDWQDLQPIARSYIRSAASVHILCFACLEAHINMRAEERLQGRLFGEFDRLPTTGNPGYFHHCFPWQASLRPCRPQLPIGAPPWSNRVPLHLVASCASRSHSM